MSNVYDFNTGELVDDVVYLEPHQGVEEISMILNQRKRQILDIAVVWIETDGGMKFATSVTPDITLLGMVGFLEDRIIKDSD